jgi:hypothetical protein
MEKLVVIFGILVVVSVVLLGCYGWVMNIVKMFAIASEPITGLFILRGIGIFLAPLGAVLGFC